MGSVAELFLSKVIGFISILCLDIRNQMKLMYLFMEKVIEKKDKRQQRKKRLLLDLFDYIYFISRHANTLKEINLSSDLYIEKLAASPRRHGVTVATVTLHI